MVRFEPTTAFQRIPDWLLATGLALLAACVLFYRIADPAVFWWDEARVALNSLEMMHTSDPLIVTYNGQADLWNTEPPLAIWLNALSMRLFGVNELALRLPAALAALGTTMAVFGFTKRVSDRSTAVLASLMLLGIGGYVEIHVTRTAEFDSLLVLFTTLTTFSLFFAFDSGKFYGSAGFAMCAFLTKGIAGFLMGPGYLLYALICRKDVRPAVIPGLAVLAFALVYLLGREAAQAGYFHGIWLQNILRFNQAADGNNGDVGSYAYGLLWPWQMLFHFAWTKPPYLTSTFPWGWFAFLALIRPSRPVIYLFCCVISFIVVLSLAATRLSWYAAPAFPLIAVLSALGVRRIGEITGKKLTFIFLPLALLFIGLNIWKIERELQTLPLSPVTGQANAIRHLDRNVSIQIRPQLAWRTPKVRDGRIVGTELYLGAIEFYRRQSDNIVILCDAPEFIPDEGFARPESCHGPDYSLVYPLLKKRDLPDSRIVAKP